MSLPPPPFLIYALLSVKSQVVFETIKKFAPVVPIPTAIKIGDLLLLEVLPTATKVSLDEE